MGAAKASVSVLCGSHSGAVWVPHGNRMGAYVFGVNFCRRMFPTKQSLLPYTDRLRLRNPRKSILAGVYDRGSRMGAIWEPQKLRFSYCVGAIRESYGSRMGTKVHILWEPLGSRMGIHWEPYGSHLTK